MGKPGVVIEKSLVLALSQGLPSELKGNLLYKKAKELLITCST